MKITPNLFEHWQSQPDKDELRIVPIGGLGEFGMNTIVVHTAKSLFLIDCGQLFPSEDQPGIDSIVPDFAYLDKFSNKIDAVLLTHGHEDHIGALPYFLERWEVPVYGSAFTMGILENKLREFNLWSSKRMHVIEDFERKSIGIGEIEAEWIPVVHSIPDACSIALHTPWGTVFHTGDYKLDKYSMDGRLNGNKRLKELGNTGTVSILLSDSTNVLKTSLTPTEEICRKGLQEAFEVTKGKLFIATFSSNIYRIKTILEISQKENRKVCLIGRSLERNVSLAINLGLISLPENILIDVKDIPLFLPREVLIICTGTQGESMSALTRIIRGEVKSLKMIDGDRLILSSRVIPGNEVGVARMLDSAARLGVETTTEEFGPVHATGHGHRGDLVEMINMLKPKYIVPIHGSYRNLKAHGKLAQNVGYTKDRIFFLDGGECLQVNFNNSVNLAGKVPVGKRLIDQGVSHVIDAMVVRDRLILQEDGIVVVVLLIDPATRELAIDPTILSRGFVVLSNDQAYVQMLKETAMASFEGAPLKIKKDNGLLIEFLRQSLRRIIRKTTQTRPVVVPIILDSSSII